MSFSTSGNSSPAELSPILASFQQQPGLPFADGLSAEGIQAAFDAEGVDFAQEEDEIYTPAVVVWAWLSQMIHKGEHRSCRAAVARVVVLLIALGRKPCSNNTSTYCKARAKLPESVIQRMVYDLAASCERQVLTEWLCVGRRVKLVDGAVLSMPDTPENQREYPQSASQQEGVGFPSLRTVVLMSLATGMLTAMALGPCSGKETSELALFRQVLDRLDRGDIVLADRFFCSYFMVCLLQRLGVDFVSRLHQRRTADFRRGKRLGPGDHIVEWPRPDRPEWMDQATYDQMPLSLTIREMEYKVNKKGFRADALVIVTTLLDAVKYDRDDLATIYRKRWTVELDIRAVKCTLGIDVLSCKSPEMARKEVWVAMLAYNLIRQKILQSALAKGKIPRQLSFTAAVQKIAASWTAALLLDDTRMRVLIETTLKHLSDERVGERPDRVEPRAVKRRPKALAYLMKPRGDAVADLMKAKAA